MAAPTPSRPPVRDTQFVLLALFAGLALRLLWVTKTWGGPDALLNGAEAMRVALAFARGDGIADPYFSGQGPSAHLSPLYPMLTGSILWLLGSGRSAMLALTALALTQWVASVLVARRLFALLGLGAGALRWATVLLCLLPAYVAQEVIDFRFWEGGVAALLGLANLCWMIGTDRRAAFPLRRQLMVAFVVGLTFFIAPPVGIAVALGWGIVASRRLPSKDVTRFALIGVAGAALFVAPWAWRNQQLLGAPVLTRSNAGLELALANHPAAVSGDRAPYVFVDRFFAIHPYGNPPLRKIIQREGEVAYSRRLGQEARQWIAAHPLDFARLYVRHLGQFFFPRPWQFHFSSWGEMLVERSVAISGVQALGLIGLGLLLWRRRPGAGYVALYVMALALPFAAFQPTMRYSYLVWTVLAFPAVWLLGAAGRRIGQIGKAAYLAATAHHGIEYQPAEQA